MRSLSSSSAGQSSPSISFNRSWSTSGVMSRAFTMLFSLSAPVQSFASSSFALSGVDFSSVNWGSSNPADLALFGACSMIASPVSCVALWGAVQLPMAQAGTFPASIDLGALTSEEGLILQGATIGDYSGIAVSSAGDVNGDGIGDFLVGAYWADPLGRTEAGESYVLFGNSSLEKLDLATLTAEQGLVLRGATAGDKSGTSVSAVGDVNADGIDDFAVGAFLADPLARNDAGVSYVVFGSTQLSSLGVLDFATLTAPRGLVLQGAAAGDYAGRSVGAVGDINKDGIADLVVSAFWADPLDRVDAGAVYVIFGNTQLGSLGTLDLGALTASQGAVFQGAVAGDYTGRSVSTAGDVNADGIVDLLIGAHSSDPLGRTDAGISYVIFGGSQFNSIGVLDLATLSAVQGFTVYGGAAGDRSGTSVSSAGDVNADGIDDFIVGAWYAAVSGRTEAGTATILFGGSYLSSVEFLDVAALNSSQALVLQGSAAHDEVGYSVSAAGDVNGDGLADVIVGAYRADPLGRIDAGASYVLFGASDLGTLGALDLASFSATQGVIIQGAIGDDRSGISVSGAGDVNSDGLPDLVVGGYYASPFDRFQAGVTSVVFGQGDLSLLKYTVTLSEGNTITVTQDLLKANKCIADCSNLAFTVSGSSQGHFAFTVSPASPITTFTQTDINSESIVFVHDGSNNAPTASVTVSNGAENVGATAITINFTPLNDEPVLTVNEMSIIQGRSRVLTSSELQANDEESADGMLVFTVSEVENGQFEYQAQAGQSITTFSQQDVSDAKVVFVHGGGEVVPSYKVSVSDSEANTAPVAASITFNLDAAPVFEENNLSIAAGETIILDSSMLQVTDADNASSDLVIHVVSVEYGFFARVSNPGVAITQFTQEEVDNGQIQFKHDGTNNVPNYSLEVTDGMSVATPNGQVVMDYRNEEPVFVNNNLSIGIGETVVLSSSVLEVTDTDNSIGDLRIIVASVDHGFFAYTSAPTVAITEFSQADVNGGNIQFKHDGSDFPAEYRLQATDDIVTTSESQAQIVFAGNDVPQLLTSSLVISQGETVVLDTTNFVAEDGNDDDSSLLFMLSNVEHGYFALGTVSGAPITGFNQAQLTNGEVIFRHDDSDMAPSFDVSVSDGRLSTVAVSGSIDFTPRPENHPPELHKPIPDRLEETVGKLFSFEVPKNTFVDPDGDKLVLSARQKGGDDLPNWVEFDPSNRRFSGTPVAEGLSKFSIFAKDPDGAAARSDFSIQAKEPPFEWGVLEIAIAGGGLLVACFALLLSCYLCKRDRRAEQAKELDNIAGEDCSSPVERLSKGSRNSFTTP